MPYRYIALENNGNLSRGVLEVESEEAAERVLWGRNLTVVQLTPLRKGVDWQSYFPTFLGPRRTDVIIFSNQLANLIESGIPVVTALELLAEEVSSKPLRAVLEEVVDDVRTGSTLSAAFQRHEYVFPELYCRMIEIGERTGNLDLVLRRVAALMERERSLLQKIRSAVTYPAIVVMLAIVVISILVNFTLPPLTRLYVEFDAQLPWITRALIRIVQFTETYRVHLLVSTLTLILVGFLYFTHPRGRAHYDRFVLGVPVIGRIVLEGSVSRLSRTLATLLNAGLGLPESLELTAQVIHNRTIQSRVEELRQEALQGRGLSEPLARMKVFPGMLAQVIRVGEESGTLDSHLVTLADFYEEDVERLLGSLTTLLEPAMIIFVGLLVAGVAISVILPMYSLLGAIR